MNWVENLKFFQDSFAPNEYGGAPCGGCQVHRGFFQSYQNLKDSTGFVQYAQGLLKNECNGCELLLTGHSLGGALTTIAAFENWGTKIRFINFGSPRVGNKNFEDAFRNIVPESTRVTHASDLVVQMPTTMMGYEYHHISRETFYDTDTHFNLCNDNPNEDSTCSISTWGMSIADHTRYLGMSTGCGDADALAVSYLRNQTDNSGHYLEFFDQYDNMIVSCGDQGFIKGIAKELHSMLNAHAEEVQFSQCLQEQLVNNYEQFFYETFTRDPTCDDVDLWGALAVKDCLWKAEVSPENRQKVLCKMIELSETISRPDLYYAYSTQHDGLMCGEATFAQ